MVPVSPRRLLTARSSSQTAAQSSSQSLPTTTTGHTILSFPNTPPLPHTSHHTATLTLHAHHPYALDLYTNFAYHTAHSLKIPTSKPAFLPTSKALYTVLKGPFVHKKAQENFEKRTHRRAIKVFDTEKEVLDLWLRYLKKNSIGGVGMKAQVWENVEFGYSSKEGEMIKGQIESTSEEDIEKAAQKLMKELTGEGEVKGVEAESKA
jgi:small subunit ribosomal protein S10